MSILTVSNLEKSYGTELLFRDVTFSIAAGQKLGLVGRNGCGKTTLLRILLGQELPDGGKVALASGRRLGYLRQEAPVHPEHTLLEEVQTVFAPLRAMEDGMQELERAMEAAQSDDDLERAMEAYSEARDAFDAAGGYHYAADVDLVLEKLGFSQADYEKLVGACSGGEQTRLALAKIVLSKPDLLVLDEPTNHLDITATEWLEGFLKGYEGAILLVSHDRYFLDAVADSIADIENYRLTVYKGNYSHFRRQKQEQWERQQVVYEQQQAEVARLEDLIKRNMGGNATQSKIRNKTRGRIERMERVDRPVTDTSTLRARFDAEGAGRIGRDVLRCEGVAKTFGERTLFSDLNFLIERGDRVGLVGPNGAGKTTLVKMILGTEQPTRGGLTLGHNVRLSYFSQHAAESLEPSSSVIGNIQDTGDMTETEARNYLARFLFVGDDVFKTVQMLSGGEKNKLALARMILEPCNLLILDEPTNHLDIASCESLTDMLAGYDGTLLLVSHDRYLLNATTTKTLALSGTGPATFFEGNYAAWREAQRAVPPAPAKKAPPAPNPGEARGNGTTAPSGPPLLGRGGEMNARELSKARVKAREAVLTTESAVHALEGRIAEVEARLAAPSGSVSDMVALAAEHTRLQDDLAAALTAWERAVADSEALGV
ncbi:MAG: ABC-F family ATP-binding cassette domain-containing protein [Armatimonadetes bacterium]|nr:ABC-F family ATP-binding cassette domain-containing protein [Armatimonadota bacterium]